MTPVPAAEFEKLLEQVRSWPAEQQQALAQAIVGGLPAAPKRKKGGLHNLVGLLAEPGVTPPTDEECERIVEEERMRKYGGS